MDNAAKKVLADLKAGKFSKVYLLQGEEAYYIDLISNYIETCVLSESERSFNQVILYGKESPVHVILTHAKRYPMMAERQVVIVREAQEIPDLGKELGQKMLLDYFQKPVPSTILVLCHRYKALDKRKEFGKRAEQLTTSLTFKKPYEDQLPDFIKEYVSSKGYGIEDRAVQILCESIGVDLTRIAMEVDKLLIAKPTGHRLKEAEVMSQVGMNREFNIFELQKALTNQDLYKACQIAEYFSNNIRKNHPLMVIAFLYSFFSKVLGMASALSMNESDGGNSLKINAYAMRDYSLALQKYSVNKLRQNIFLLREADLRLKGLNSGTVEERQLLKELVIRLIH